jgi:hypothetical protein
VESWSTLSTNSLSITTHGCGGGAVLGILHDEAPILGEHFDIVVGLSSHNGRERLRFILGHALIRHAPESGRQRLNVLTCR